MLRFTVPDNCYGPGTDKMQNILCQIHSIQWLKSAPDDNCRDQILTLVERHLESLSALDDGSNKPVVSEVVLLEGDWSTLHKGRWGVDPYNAWGNRWKAADESIGRVIHYLTQIVNSSPDAQHLLRPPLWPVENCSNICGQNLVADSEILRNEGNLKPGERDWCVAWALLCKAEIHVWNALLWELAVGVSIIQRPNPFQYLLDLYELGTFPMGWADNRYELYVPKISMGTAAT